MPGTISFCLTGKAVAVGCNEGDLLVLDIATAQVLSAFQGPNNNVRSSVQQVGWVQHVDPICASYNSCQIIGRMITWRCGGMNLVDRSVQKARVPSGTENNLHLKFTEVHCKLMIIPILRN